jgi:hypothetical protein
MLPARHPTGGARHSLWRGWPVSPRSATDAAAVGTLLGAAAALRESAVVLLVGAGTPLLEATGGRLSPAERIDVDRAIGRIDDQVTLRAAFAEGQRDPEAVVAAARTRIRAVS